MWLEKMEEKRNKKRFIPCFDFGIKLLALALVFLYRKIK